MESTSDPHRIVEPCGHDNPFAYRVTDSERDAIRRANADADARALSNACAFADADAYRRALANDCPHTDAGADIKSNGPADVIPITAAKRYAHGDTNRVFNTDALAHTLSLAFGDAERDADAF